MATKEQVIKFIELQESNLEFYKKDNLKLQQQVNDIKKMEVNWINPSDFELTQNQFSSDEIKIAFYKAKVYEGLATNEHSTVLDTFINFLNKTHHSENK